MTTPKPPGVYITEKSSGVRMIVGVGTSTPAFLGYTKVPNPETDGTATPPFTAEERTHPQLIRGWQEFADRYSIEALRQKLAVLRQKQEAGQDPTPVERKEIRVLERCFTLAEGVYGFFANGGQSCYVVGFTDPAAAVSPAQLNGSAEARTGLGGLETVPEVTMVAVPSLWDMTAAASDAQTPPALEPAKGKPLMDAAVAHCVAMRNRLAILDAPPGQPVEPLKSFVDDLTSPDTEDAAFTALYYPWLEVPGVDGTPRTVPP
ncbi:hypothetical protein ACFWIB_42915, partial [Streptomyces sp. NPDC127051]